MGWFTIHRHELPGRRKAANGILLCALFSFCVGVFLFFRGNQDLADLNVVRTAVHKVRIDRLIGMRPQSSESFSVCYELVNMDRDVGIYAGPDPPAPNDPRILSEGAEYTFYLDPTVVPTFTSCELSIRRIESKGTLVYSDEGGASRTGGLLFAAMGLLCLFIWGLARLWLRRIERRLKSRSAPRSR